MGSGVEWLPPDIGLPGGTDTPATPATPATTSRDELFAQGKEPAQPSRFVGLVQRVPIAARVAALVAVCSVIAVSLLGSPMSHRSVPDAAPPPSSPAEQVATDRAMAMVEGSAATSSLAHDYIRSTSTRGACVLVAVGQSPQSSIAAAVHRALPGYTVRGVSRTIDQFTALCAINVRAVDASGSVLVVDVAAPQHAVARQFTALTVGGRTGARRTVSIATALTRSGWSITVGVVGPLDDEPTSANLQRLSQDAGLVW